LFSYLFVCLSFYTSTSICPSVYLSAYLSVRLYLHLFDSPSCFMSACPSVNFVCPSLVCLYVQYLAIQSRFGGLECVSTFRLFCLSRKRVFSGMYVSSAVCVCACASFDVHISQRFMTQRRCLSAPSYTRDTHEHKHTCLYLVITQSVTHHKKSAQTHSHINTRHCRAL
jgi:hypothetical protein